MKNIILALSLFFSIVTYSQAKKNFNIGLLLDSQTEETQELLSRLINEIKAVVGEDATISFSEANMLVNDFNLEKSRANYNTLLDGNTDIILAFGLVNNVVISKLKTFQKPTILFGAVNKDFDFKEADNQTSVISNFTNIIKLGASNNE